MPQDLNHLERKHLREGIMLMLPLSLLAVASVVYCWEDVVDIWQHLRNPHLDPWKVLRLLVWGS